MPSASRERLAVIAVVVFFAAVYVVYGLFRHWHFQSGAYDLGIFDQAIWRLSRFEMPASSIKGIANLFGDHFHPIIVLFAPLYWVASRPETLIVAQGLLLAGAIVPIYLCLRRQLPPGTSLALCASYGFFWGIQHAAAYDVHEVAFAPILTASAVLSVEQKRWPTFWVAVVGLMLTKEDLIPLATFLGLYLLMVGERRRGLALAVSSLAFFVFVVGWLIPYLSGSPGYAYAGIYGDLVRKPWMAVAALVTPSQKLLAVLMWVAPFAFLPLLSPRIVLLLPLALERLLATDPGYWGYSHHYGAPLAAILVLAAGDGLARVTARATTESGRRRAMAWAAGACVVLSSVLPGSQPFWDLFERGHYQATTEQRTWPAILAQIPQDASVVAQGALVPHLTHRPAIYLLEEGGPDADILVAARGLNPWPAADTGALESLILERQRRGYRTLVEQDGWILLRREETSR